MEDQDIKKNSAYSKIRKAIPLIEQSKQMKRGKTKKINKKPEKKATEKGDSQRESEEDSEEETSEEDSPKKPINSSRATRVDLKHPVYAYLNEELSNLKEDQKREWSEGLFKAFRAKSARDEENPNKRASMVPSE